MMTPDFTSSGISRGPLELDIDGMKTISDGFAHFQHNQWTIQEKKTDWDFWIEIAF
jgi:hypothetical protein